MTRARQHHGFALIAVLWTVAALGLIVSAVVAAQRQEVRWVTVSRQMTQALAVGQAATHLLANDLLHANAKLPYTRQYAVSFANQVVAVEVMALDGLVDINKAPRPLLVQLLITIGMLPPPEAENLAQQWVTHRDAARALGGWQQPAELMALPDMTYDTYARLEPYLTSHSDTGSGLVDPLFAPRALLNVLSKGDGAIADQVWMARQRGGVGVDTSRLEQSFIGTGGRKKLRLTALVDVGGDARVSVVTDLDLGRGPGKPWRVLQPSRAISRSVDQ